MLLGSCESFWTAGAACKQFATVCDFVGRSFYCEIYLKSKVNVLILFVESYYDEAVINSWIE